MDIDYKISDLAERTGVTKRTIHYYVNRGLLPPPHGSGAGSYYTEEHLVKLLLIKKLQSKYLPLEQIAKIVTGLSQEEAELKLAEDREAELEFEPKESVPNRISLTELYKVDLGMGLELVCSKEVYEQQLDKIMAIMQYAKRLQQDK